MQTRSTDPAAAGWTTRHFTATLAGIALAGLLIRVGYVLTVGSDVELGLDAAWYVVQGQILADGHGYADPRMFLLTGQSVPTANFPPLWPLLLAAADLVGLDSQTGNQLVGVILGTATILATGLLGRRIAGPTVGVVAAVLVAVSPALIAADGSLMAESAYVLLITGAVLAAYRCLDRPTPGRFAVVGALLGLAILTRSDALFLTPIMTVVLAWRVRDTGTARRIGLAAVLLVGFAVPWGAWVGYSSVRLGAPVLTTSNAGNVLSGANCGSTYHGALLGAWDSDCAVHLAPGADEVAFAAQGRSDGIAYARAHLARTPRVATARVLRTFGLWDPGQTAELESVETRDRTWQTIAWGFDLVLVGAAIVGGVLGVRRRIELVPVLAVVAGVVLTAAVSNGNQRFRLAADPSLAALAAVAICWFLTRWVIDPVRSGRRLRGRPGTAS